MSNITKLITKEDKFHIHKTCGIYILLNFIFQLEYYSIYNDVYLTPCILLPHIILPLSSFFFNVLSKRPVGHRMNMFIWNELRLHAIIFSLRSVIILLYTLFT